MAMHPIMPNKKLLTHRDITVKIRNPKYKR